MRHRLGTSLFEVVIAAGVLAVSLTVCLKLLAALGDQQQRSERRAWAQETATNTLQRVAALPWDQMTQANVANWPLPDHIHNVLPAAELDVDVLDEIDALPSKRIRVTLNWQDRAGHRTSPVRLTSWVYATEVPTP